MPKRWANVFTINANPGPNRGRSANCARTICTPPTSGKLSPGQQRECGYVIKALRAKHEDKRLAKLERRHIQGWKDQMADRPGAFNKRLRVVKRLISFAADRDAMPKIAGSRK